MWERSARPLPQDYGKDRPASRTVDADQLTEMTELWGQRAVDRLIASGRVVVEAEDQVELDHAPPLDQGRDQDRANDHSPEEPGQADGSDRGGPGDTPTAAGFADDEPHDRGDDHWRGGSNGWDHVGGEKPDRASIHVNESRQTYILDGNGRGGGGHFPGTGLPNKTEYVRHEALFDRVEVEDLCLCPVVAG